MNKLIIVILLSVLSLTGCASNCTHACVFGFGPGSQLFEAYAEHADNQDPCQFKGKPANYQLPNFCGTSSGKVVRVTKVGNSSYIINRN